MRQYEESHGDLVLLYYYSILDFFHIHISPYLKPVQSYFTSMSKEFKENQSDSLLKRSFDLDSLIFMNSIEKKYMIIIMLMNE